MCPTSKASLQVRPDVISKCALAPCMPQGLERRSCPSKAYLDTDIGAEKAIEAMTAAAGDSPGGCGLAWRVTRKHI